MGEKPELYRVNVRVEISRLDEHGRYQGGNSLRFDEYTDVGPVGLPQLAELLVKCHALTRDLADEMTAPVV